jgi:hypothetical protein
MSILSELNTLLSPVAPIETGIFSGVPPGEYIVLTPLADSFPLTGDDAPLAEMNEVRISLFTKNNYLARARQIVRLLFRAGFSVTARQYVGREDDTGFHNYAIDVAKAYEWKEA